MGLSGTNLYHPFHGSGIEVIEFYDEHVHTVNGNHTKSEKINERVLNGYHTKIETSSEPINEPFINNTNIINYKLAYAAKNKNSDLHHHESAAAERSSHLCSVSKKITRGGWPPASVEEVKCQSRKKSRTTNPKSSSPTCSPPSSHFAVIAEKDEHHFNTFEISLA